MKHLFYIISIFICTLNIQGQYILNGDFEQWEGNEPLHWNTANSFTSSMSVYGCTPETTNPYDGLSSLKLQTKTVIFAQVPGLATNGLTSFNILNNPPITITGGKAFNKRPQYLNGYYKFIPQNNDTCLIISILTKHNASTNSTDTIAFAIFEEYLKVNEWKAFQTEYQYFSTESPDTNRIIILSSSTSNPKNNTTLWVDNLSLSGGNLNNNIKPFNIDRLFYIKNNNLVLLNNDIKSVRIYDISGRILIQKEINQISNQSIPLSSLNKGIFIVHLENLYDNITFKIVL